MASQNLNDRQLKTGRLVLYYTILFILVAAGVFCVFMILGKSFLERGDGYRQGYFWTAELKHIMESVLSGNGLPQWNWSRGLGMQYLYRCDPFNLFASLFPMKYLELGITISLVMKLYCGGLAYLAFARELKMSNYQCIIGPVCYIFSTWFINVTMIQSSFIFIAFMLPLLTLGIDRIYRGRSPVLFILVVAYFLIRDTYLAYMAAIVAIMFMLVRYFAYNDKFSIKAYFMQIAKFVGYGFTAALLSATFCLQFILATMRASTDSTHSGGVDWFFSSSFYESFAKTLSTDGLTTGYTYIGLPILAILVLPIALKRVSIRNTSSLMTWILLLMTISPVVSSMFNGFSYSTGRWYVMIVFFASWATMECFDLEDLRKRGNMLLMIVWLVVFAVCTIGFDAVGIIGLSLRGKAFILLNIMTGAALLFVMGAVKSSRITIKHRQVATVALTGLMLFAGWTLSFYLYQNKFMDIGEANAKLEQSTQRVSGSLDKALGDDGFYRTDQVEWINCHKDMQMPVCENLWWQSKSIYVYDSFTSSKQLDFNKYLGNNYGYLMRVYLLSNDNRMGLDFLYGVKYFLGDDTRSTGLDKDGLPVTNSQYNANDYADYGFSFKENVDGIDVYENKYDSGLGFAYDKYISETEFLKLSRAEREQAILQAVVIPDDECGEISAGMEQIDADDVDTAVKNIKYEVVATDGLTMEKGRIVTDKEDATITIKPVGIEKSQVLVSFDNLVNADDDSFKVNCTDGKVNKVVNTGHTNQCIPDVVDFDMNMGYYDSFDGTFTITINHKGEYSFDRFYISAMSVANYDKYAAQRVAEKYQVSDYDSWHVSGTLDAKADGVIYFSIPQYTNWDVYIDGQKAEKLENVNIAFLGVQVTEGHHDVELKYNNVSLKFGIAASVAGAVLTVIFGLYFRRRRKDFVNGNTK